MMLRVLCAAVMVLSLASGCARDRDARNDMLDSLWEAGFGFNNPNAASARDRARR